MPQAGALTNRATSYSNLNSSVSVTYQHEHLLPKLVIVLHCIAEHVQGLLLKLTMLYKQCIFGLEFPDQVTGLYAIISIVWEIPK